ncbi:MAG: outer membrane protein [Acidobacteriota bacterium]
MRSSLHRPVRFALLTALIALIVLTGRLVHGHDGLEERLAKDRPEFWAMKLVGSELLMTLMDFPHGTETGRLELGLEAGWLPSLSAQQRLVGFSGTKEENLNRTPVFARPRVSLGLPHEFTFSAGYVPPARIDGIRPNILTLAAGRPVLSTSIWRLAVRFHGLVGNLRGDITCDRDTVSAGLDPVRNPYLCEAPSNDTMTIRAGGFDVSHSFAVTRSIQPYVTVGLNYFDTKFQTDARYSGIVDHSRLLGAGSAFSVGAGLSYRVARRMRVTGEAYYTPLDVQRYLQPRITDGLFNLRALLAYELR